MRRRVPALTNDPSPLFQSPEAVGPYRVRRVLASGTLGPRLLVEDDRGRLLSLKLITDVGSDAAALVEVLDHVRTQVPAHPGLLPVTDVGASDDGVYLASPVVDAPSVEGRLRGGRQSLDATLSWLRPVVAGLQAAHDAGVWHGAIHPRDVLVSDDGGLLTGVGVAPALEHLSLQAPIRVPYTAPERASGGRWDTSADQYALAMLALDALSGRRLIAGTIPAFDRWSLAETPTEDARLHEVFGRALHPDPDKRYASLEEWLAALAGPERAVAEAAALSRFAREGVILAAAAAAASGESSREIEVQHLEDPEGVALSLFPEEDGPTSPLAAAPGADAPASEPDEEPEQEWLVADVPDEETVVAAAADAEPDALAYRVPPSEHPSIDVATAGPSPAIEWRLADEDMPPIAEPPRSWDAPADDTPRRAPWLVALVLLVLAAVGYGTWRSLDPTPPAAPVADAPTAIADDVPAADAAPATPAPPPVAPAAEAPPRVAERQVVPQAPVATTPTPPADARRQATPPAAPRATATPPADEPAAAAEMGRALIRSSPAGEVRVNGRPRGETPVVLRDLPFGSYVIAISRPGFRTVEREIALLPSQPVASITVDLERGEGTAPAVAAAAPPPAPPVAPPVAPRSGGREAAPAGMAAGGGTQTGGIFVVSSPAMARLFVDGQAYGSTPAGIPGLSPGVHRVRVEAPGYRAWEGQVMVVAGTRVRVEATLQQGQE